MYKHFVISICFCFFVAFYSCSREEYEQIQTTAPDIQTLTNNIFPEAYPKIKHTSDFPIVAWGGIPSDNLSVERFVELRESGININLTSFENADQVQQALDLGKETGVKILIRCPEIRTSPKDIAKRFMHHAATFGYYVVDEPSIAALGPEQNIINSIRTIDSTHYCYVNLYPDYATNDQLGTSNYTEYIEKVIQNLSLNLLSFDYYPIINGNYLRNSWYSNLEIIRNKSVTFGIPFWAFALTTSHSIYPIPTIQHIRLEVYSDLAYGAKGIQYYTYWTKNSPNFQYISGPIEKDGTRTVVYDIIKQVNSEINVYADIFLSVKVVNVGHYGKFIPKGAQKFTTFPDFVKAIDIKCNTALISEMENDSNSFLMIQNNDLTTPIEVNITVDADTKLVLKNGSIIPFSLINKPFKIESGDMVMFMK